MNPASRIQEERAAAMLKNRGVLYDSSTMLSYRCRSGGIVSSVTCTGVAFCTSAVGRLAGGRVAKPAGTRIRPASAPCAKYPRSLLYQ